MFDVQMDAYYLYTNQRSVQGWNYLRSYILIINLVFKVLLLYLYAILSASHIVILR